MAQSMTYSTTAQTLRFYNRDHSKTHEMLATDNECKKALKQFGFKWDNSNHSYLLKQVSPDTVKEIENHFRLVCNKY